MLRRKSVQAGVIEVQDAQNVFGWIVSVQSYKQRKLFFVLDCHLAKINEAEAGRSVVGIQKKRGYHVSRNVHCAHIDEAHSIRFFSGSRVSQQTLHSIWERRLTWLNRLRIFAILGGSIA